MARAEIEQPEHLSVHQLSVAERKALEKAMKPERNSAIRTKTRSRLSTIERLLVPAVSGSNVDVNSDGPALKRVSSPFVVMLCRRLKVCTRFFIHPYALASHN